MNRAPLRGCGVPREVAVRNTPGEGGATGTRVKHWQEACYQG